MFTIFELETSNYINIFIRDTLKFNLGTCCKLGQMKHCGPITIVTINTVNSVICRSKYPKLFEGPTNNTLTACIITLRIIFAQLVKRLDAK